MENFNSKYVVQDRGYVTRCWTWTAYKDRAGYGRFGFEGKAEAAHRVAWVLFRGDLPTYPQFELDHLCGNPDCVNPDHLEAVTHEENHRRRRIPFVPFCKNGHEYTPENTYLRPSGTKDCRACIRERARKYQQSKRAPA